jgi:hypothetical protein
MCWCTKWFQDRVCSMCNNRVVQATAINMTRAIVDDRVGGGCCHEYLERTFHLTPHLFSFPWPTWQYIPRDSRIIVDDASFGHCEWQLWECMSTSTMHIALSVCNAISQLVPWGSLLAQRVGLVSPKSKRAMIPWHSSKWSSINPAATIEIQDVPCREYQSSGNELPPRLENSQCGGLVLQMWC